MGRFGVNKHLFDDLGGNMGGNLRGGFSTYISLYCILLDDNWLSKTCKDI